MTLKTLAASIRPGTLLTALAILPLTALAQAPEAGIEQIWKRQADTVIYGGIRTDEARAFVGGEDGILRAVDKATGAEHWRYDAGAAIASAATTDDLRVYVHTRAGVVHAVGKPDGAALWRFTTGGERRWDYWDYYLSTPAVDDRQLYFGSGDHRVYAVDKRTGQLRWAVETGNIVHGEPALAGEKLIVGGFDGVMRAIDRGTGRVLWSFKTVGNAYFRNGEIPGTAMVADGIVYFGGRDYNLYALLADTGTGAWNERTPSWIVGRPLAGERDLIVVNSDGAGVFSYDPKSGKLNWSFNNSYNMFAGAEAVGDAHVAVASLDGRITLLNRSDGRLAAVFETTASHANHGRFFTDEGKPDYTGVATLEDLMDLYDRQLARLGGIPGRLAVDGDVIHYAAADGEFGALRVTGITPAADGGR